MLENTNINKGWIGVDLDRTLAFYDKFRGLDHIGEPIPLMVERVRYLLSKGIEIRIFTARHDATETNAMVTKTIQDWLEQKCNLPRLKVTNAKDKHCWCIFDDISISVEQNTGNVVETAIKQVQLIDHEIGFYNHMANAAILPTMPETFSVIE